VTRYVQERRDAFGVEPICRTLGVPVSTHYARRSRRPSVREHADRELLVEIEDARSGRRRVYGARKTWKELRRRDVDVGRDRVARVMRQNGLAGKLRGSKKRATIPDAAAAERARDLLQRDFTATRPNEKWVADITYIHRYRVHRSACPPALARTRVYIARTSVDNWNVGRMRRGASVRLSGFRARASSRRRQWLGSKRPLGEHP
jgi:transposase InsO family protein